MLLTRNALCTFVIALNVLASSVGNCNGDIVFTVTTEFSQLPGLPTDILGLDAGDINAPVASGTFVVTFPSGAEFTEASPGIFELTATSHSFEITGADNSDANHVYVDSDGMKYIVNTNTGLVNFQDLTNNDPQDPGKLPPGVGTFFHFFEFRSNSTFLPTVPSANMELATVSHFPTNAPGGALMFRGGGSDNPTSATYTYSDPAFLAIPEPSAIAFGAVFLIGGAGGRWIRRRFLPQRAAQRRFPEAKDHEGNLGFLTRLYRRGALPILSWAAYRGTLRLLPRSLADS